MYVIFMPIHSIYCDTRYIDILKIVSMLVSLSCVLRYDDTSMYHPISSIMLFATVNSDSHHAWLDNYINTTIDY